MKTISLFLISLVVSANLYANESSKSKNEYENNNDHMGNHIHDGKMTNHMNMNGMTDEEMKKMHDKMNGMNDEEMKKNHEKLDSMSNEEMKKMGHK